MNIRPPNYRSGGAFGTNVCTCECTIYTCNVSSRYINLLLIGVFLVISKALSSLDSHCGRYGCCADGKTPSPDPEKAGCPEKFHQEPKVPERKVAATLHNKTAEHSHQKFACFEVTCGCCPDGVTVAMGPNFQGCGVQRPSVPKGSWVVQDFFSICYFISSHSILFGLFYFIPIHAIPSYSILFHTHLTLYLHIPFHYFQLHLFLFLINSNTSIFHECRFLCLV